MHVRFSSVTQFFFYDFFPRYSSWETEWAKRKLFYSTKKKPVSESFLLCAPPPGKHGVVKNGGKYVINSHKSQQETAIFKINWNKFLPNDLQSHIFESSLYRPYRDFEANWRSRHSVNTLCTKNWRRMWRGDAWIGDFGGCCATQQFNSAPTVVKYSPHRYSYMHICTT